MKPVARPRHLLAVLIFVAVSGVYANLAMVDGRLSKSQVNIATAAVKRYQPRLFQRDPVFGQVDGVELWRLHTPAYQGMLELSLVPSRYKDPTLPFRVMAGVLAMIYLCGMYALVYHQCRDWSSSAFVAVLSSTVIEVLGPSTWGVGSLASITPPTLVLAVTPLIVLAYLRYQRQWRLLLVFAFIGLMGNLDLAAAMNLTVALLLTYAASRRFGRSCWLMALGCGACSVLAALPYACYYFALRPGAPADAHVSTEAFSLAFGSLLYPDALKSLLDPRLLGRLLVLVVPALAVLSRVERFRARYLKFWVLLLVAAAAVTIGLHWLSQAIGTWRGTGPPIIDFIGASHLVMLPLYVLFAQGLSNVFRLIRGHHILLRWGCAAVIAAWMIPSDNLRVARHAVAEVATSFLDEDAMPRYIKRHRRQRAERAELTAIAKWAGQADNTDQDAVFVTDRVRFRMLARRAVLATRDDLRYIYYLVPWRLSDWIERVNDQDALLHPPQAGGADPERLKSFLSRQEHLKDAPEFYVILETNVAPEDLGVLKQIDSENWGEHYRLYRCQVK